MHALIRLGEGKYYTSVVLGKYRDTDPEDAWLRLREEQEDSAYFIVLNEDKTELVRRYYTDYSINCGGCTVLVFDGSTDGWTLDKNGYGGVDFLPKAEALRITDGGKAPSSLLEKCLELDGDRRFDESFDLTKLSELERFKCVTDSLFDTRIKALTRIDTDKYYALFADGWGYDAELWLGGNVDVNLTSEISSKTDPWCSAEMGLRDGVFYICDSDFADDVFDTEPLLEDYRRETFRWIKAERARAKILIK